MPTYEYACPICGIVEAFQSIKEKALTRCPRCGKQKVTRVVSAGAGVIFKGSGFWETDYNRSKDYSSKAKAEKTKAKDDGGSPTPPPEPKSKPETKTFLKKADSPPPAPPKKT